MSQHRLAVSGAARAKGGRVEHKKKPTDRRAKVLEFRFSSLHVLHAHIGPVVVIYFLLYTWIVLRI